ncbi:ComEC/Rec2 family competence protein [Runella aurantiaca]|uniref:ComEC family competence protein n=1 Tax=Runella aurantiaca TaxID=2282308 RepID=A0A369ID40_9BACT|nr:ComEC/Rec2 family competence protein [Runella aurantiaca]RDB07588.1 ComEC family competence protein [Runella aurantiaca]
MNVLLRCCIAFCCGILLHKALPEHWLPVINGPIMGGVAVVFIAFFFLVLFSRGNRYSSGTLMIVLFAGLGWLRTPQAVVEQDWSQLTAYVAVVLSPPETRAKTYKVEVELRRGKGENGWHPMLGKVLIYLDKMAEKPRYGQVLLVRGQPRRVESPQNPAQFDYQKFLGQKQIYHQHYLKATDFLFTSDYQGVWYKSWAFAVSEWSDAALRRLVVPDREYAVAKAMILGLRDEMDSELIQSYSAAGAVHVLSVSGFHIAIFISILTFMLKRLEKRRYGRWLSLGITLITMWFYAVLTGLSAPVIRSALMFTIFLLASPLKRKENGANALFGSALILLAIDPLLLFSVSFQLSYAALGGIIFLQPVLYQYFTPKTWLVDKLWEMTTVALAAQFITFPIAVYYFHQFPTYFLLANPFVALLATAMLPVAMVALLVSWVPYLSILLGWGLTGITWLLNEIVIWTDLLPFSTLEGLSLSAVELGLVYGIMAMLVALVYYREVRWGGYALALSALLCILQLKEMAYFNQQKLVVVHSVSRQSVVSLMNGKEALLLADSAFFQPNQQPFNFYLKNFYDERNVRSILQQPLVSFVKPSRFVKDLPFGKLIVWQGKSILLVEKSVQTTIPPVVDYVVIRNTAFRKVEELLRIFGNQKLIFDNSNKFYALENLRKQAKELGLPWYFVHENGAYLDFL